MTLGPELDMLRPILYSIGRSHDGPMRPITQIVTTQPTDFAMLFFRTSVFLQVLTQYLML
jgi:hypothetical protein